MITLVQISREQNDEKGLSTPRMMVAESPNFTTSPRRPTPMTRFCSIFNQLLQLFPRGEFQKAVVDTKAERHARGFTCWGQFVAMLFCQLGRAHSLREICGGLASCEGKLAHLGIAAPKRSTLAYANAHRPWELYQAVFYQLLERCRAVAGPKKFRFKDKLLSLDTTVIDLCAEVFPWATFRRRKGAVKLHFTLDHDGYLPTVLVITEGKRHDMTGGAAADVCARARCWCSTWATSITPGSRSCTARAWSSSRASAPTRTTT